MLTKQIKSDMEIAMKAGDKDKVSCLRLVLSAIKYKEVDLKKALDDEEVLRVLRSQVKQVSESYEQFTLGHRQDLAQKEKYNLTVLESYLPKNLDEEKIAAIVKEIISETGATKTDFGKVMKLTMAKIAGQADGKKVNSIVAKLLN